MEQYFTTKLNTLGLDGEVLANYLISHLKDEGTASAQILTVLLCDYGLDEGTSMSIVASFCETFSRGYLLPEEEALLLPMPMTSIGTPNCSFLEEEVSRLSTSDGQHEVVTDLVESVLAGEDEDDDAVIDLYAGQFGEYEDDSQCVDFVSLIEQVEYELQTSYQCTYIFSPEAIYHALLSVKNDVFGACDQLIGAATALQNCKPCRHLLQGGCYRRDCMFEHDLYQYICRYWLFSKCSNPEVCLFSHDFAPYESPADVPADPAVQAPESETDVFPALSSKSSTAFQFMPGHGYAKAVQSTKAEQQGKASSSSFSSQPRVAWTSKNMELSSSSSVAYTSESASHPSRGVVDMNGFTELLRNSNFVAAAKAHAANAVSDQTFQRGAETRIQAKDWVASGDSLLAEYSALREQAKALSSSRTKLFQEATNAYVRYVLSFLPSIPAESHISCRFSPVLFPSNFDFRVMGMVAVERGM